MDTQLLAKDIAYIKDEIRDIKSRLDTKYVSHETFELSVQALNKAISLITKTGLFLVAPVYGAIVALLFKVFTQ